MASNIQELETNIGLAIEEGFRGNLLARGQSRSMVWRTGMVPEDGPQYSEYLSTDLHSLAYGLLSQGLRLLELDGDPTIARRAFEHAAAALESATTHSENNPERDFHRLVAAAAYHLGRFSARAYSLLHINIADANLSRAEQSLAKLILRDLSSLTVDIENWRLNGFASDDSLLATLAGNSERNTGNAVAMSDDHEESLVDLMNLVLEDDYLAAIATALLAFERGQKALLQEAIAKLSTGLQSAAELNLVSQWWCHRLTIHLLRDLWEMSFHQCLPNDHPFDSAVNSWPELRKLFISSLYRRGKSEIELWPSQLDAAKRALEFESNLVLSLPTSAGKTRIAELCILATLSQGQRVVFVTPLRALSAQTEVILQRTFQPLGKTVSSLYGSIGASGADVDALRTRDIIVATPEKLDFALRSEPALLDDVGLIVLDEGHMIGLNEREVRYEAQIQRLLRREDAKQRRIVCLSAILPDGDQLEDFVGWLTMDKPDGLIKNQWRPTRLRYGEVVWKRDHAQLTVSVGDEKPFIARFLSAVIPPKKKRTTPFPKDQRELCLAAAWRLVEDGQTVMIFCPKRKSVMPFATAIVDLHSRGALASVFDGHPSLLTPALTIGAEWFGTDNVLLQCLSLGVAVHHGALPTPYRKEIEKLLRNGVLKVTISSPTLAQGLNLSATSLLFYGLCRTREPIDVSEFRNVVGRAGRAYVDIEGLVLYPMFDGVAKRRREWSELIDDSSGREMESGLLRLTMTLLLRMAAKLGTKNVDAMLQYVAGNAAWKFPEISGEEPDVKAKEASNWRAYITSLDTAILSLLGDQLIDDDNIEATLDHLLSSSLFKRRLEKRKESTRKVLSASIVERAKYIWSQTTSAQRRGYFLAGVGLETGQSLDALAQTLEEFLILANDAIEQELADDAIAYICKFAELVFTVEPFIPETLPGNWQLILRLWLTGAPLSTLPGSDTDDVMAFVEQGLIYKLPWAMEAVRVRALAHEEPSSDLKLSCLQLKFAVAAVETGTLNTSAAYLMQAGFNSRLASIAAVGDSGGKFNSSAELLVWLQSDTVQKLTEGVDWPTVETHGLWLDFVRSFGVRTDKVWHESTGNMSVVWTSKETPKPGTPLRLGNTKGAEMSVFSAGYELLGKLSAPPNANRAGLLSATVSTTENEILLEYLGPGDL